MRINKITTGFVIQTYDTNLKQWTRQEFVAGNPVEYEEDGTDQIVDPGDIWKDEPEPYLPFDMTQPEGPVNERSTIPNANSPHNSGNNSRQPR